MESPTFPRALDLPTLQIVLPDGPRTPAFWQTLQFLRDPRGYSRKISARYGKTTRFRALNGKGVAVGDSELARQLFATDPDLFETPSVLGELFGQFSVLATAGSPHRKQRKL